jgi:hypothetical protein
LKQVCISVVLESAVVVGEYHVCESKINTPPAHKTPFPSGHDVHLLLVEVSLYVPAEQTSHAALFKSGTVPSPQRKHAVALAVADTFPAPHAKHAVAVDSACRDRYFPG